MTDMVPIPQAFEEEIRGRVIKAIISADYGALDDILREVYAAGYQSGLIHYEIDNKDELESSPETHETH